MNDTKLYFDASRVQGGRARTPGFLPRGMAHCPLSFAVTKVMFFKRYYDPRTALKFYHSDHIAVIVFEGTTEDSICKHLSFQFSTNDRERVVISIHNSS